MGQEKEVHVVRFKCEGTREDEISAMQAAKEEELRDTLMSQKMGKTNHTLHSFFALIGIPKTDDDGNVIGLGKPKGEHLPEVSEESYEEDEEVGSDEDTLGVKEGGAGEDTGVKRGCEEASGPKGKGKAKDGSEKEGDKGETKAGEQKNAEGNENEEVKKEMDGDGDRENAKGADHSNENRDDMKGTESSMEDKVTVNSIESDDGDKEYSEEANSKNGVEEKGSESGGGKRLGLMGQEKDEDGDVEMGEA